MAITNKLRRWFGLSDGIPTAQAASVLTPYPDPKVKSKPASKPSFMTSAQMPDTNIRPTDRNIAAMDVARTNRMLGTRNVLRELSHVSPDLSAAVNAYIRTSITRSFTAVARNPDGTANREATNLLWQVINRMDLVPDFSKGYAGHENIRSSNESNARELILFGAMASELVLDEALLPKAIRPLSVTNIEFKPKQDRLIPVQTVGGVEFVLDTPCFFYTGLDRDLTEVYPSSPMEAAVKPVFFQEEFMSDIQRVVKRQVHPRINVIVDSAEIRKFAPPKAKHDPDKMDEYMTAAFAELEQGFNALNPEDVIITEDYIKVSLLNNGNISLSREWEALEQLANSKMATGAKVLPAILGHQASSSNIASTETMLFMKNAEGMVQFKLNDHMSRILTLAIRLFGLDCYVEFTYEPIDLRPEAEMISFKQARQSMVLEQLSLGMLTDDEASLILTGFLPPETMPPLSGTFFRSKAREAGGLDESSNNGSALNQDLNSDAPKGSRGTNKQSNPVKE